MSAPPNEYERYLVLADREACDEPLCPDERAFCRAFELRHAPRRLGQSGEIATGPDSQPYLPANHELAMYAELADVNRAPDAASRLLVDRALARLDAEEAAQMPVVLDHGSEKFPHHDLLISLHDECPAFFSRFERVIEIIGNDAEDSRSGRLRFKFYRDRGYELRHFDLSGIDFS